jgi:putative glutamine amidotransferase
MSVPVVGLTLRPIAGNGRPPYLMRNRAYYEALEGGGAAVMSLPVSPRADRLRALYDRCDAICVPGGPDVQPRLYGEEERRDCRVDADAELDDVETVLISWAIEDGKPLLAICRGAQVLNVALGGTLWQDLLVQFDGALRHDHAESHRDVVHQLTIERGSRLRDLTGADVIEVNSRHHQAIRDPAPSLTVTAFSTDGVIEAVEDESRRFVVGVQCHPEDLYAGHEWSRRLFRDFVSASSGG